MQGYSNALTSSKMKKKKNFDSSRFFADESLISASAVPDTGPVKAEILGVESLAKGDNIFKTSVCKELCTAYKRPRFLGFYSLDVDNRKIDRTEGSVRQ